MNRVFYATCFVPSCANTTNNSRNKVFVRVPGALKLRWCRQLGIKNKVSASSRLYCCEEHLNLKEDLENYYYWKLMKGDPKLKSTAKLWVKSTKPTTTKQDGSGADENSDTSLSTSDTGDTQRKGEDASHSSFSELQKLLMQTEELSQPRMSTKKANNESSSTLSRNFPLRNHIGIQCSVKMVDKSTNFRSRVWSHKPRTPKLLETQHTMCRVCLKMTGALSLSDKDGDVQYRAKIMRWTSLVILKSDGLPNFICAECAEVLNAAHEFFEQCEASDRELRSQPLAEAEVAEVYVKLEQDAINLTPEDEIMTYEYLEEEIEEEEHGKEETSQYDSSDASDKSSPSKSRDQQKDESYEPDQTETESDSCSEPEEKRKVVKKKRTHPKENLKRKEFQCIPCRRSFAFEKSLSRHVERHGQQRRLVCETCGAIVLSKGHLFRHQLSHTGLKPHKCQVCDKAFNHPDVLNRHTELHTLERKYNCDLCPKAFKTKRALYKHVNLTMTHANDKIKRLSCNFCDMTFGAKSTLITHIKNKHFETFVVPFSSS